MRLQEEGRARMTKTSFTDFSASFPSFPAMQGFLPALGKEVGRKLEGSFSFISNILFHLYIFFHIYLKNKEERKRKYSKYKGTDIYPGGCERGSWERRERRVTA